MQHDADDRSPAGVADALGLPTVDVETALAYWAEYRDEIDTLVFAQHVAQDEALVTWERRRALDAL